jgi:glucokinase
MVRRNLTKKRVRKPTPLSKRGRNRVRAPSMMLAGDVGGTKTNLAICTNEDGRLRVVAEQNFLNRSYVGIEEIVKEFLAGQDCEVTQACFGIAAPIVAGRAKMPNLPWVIDSALLTRALPVDRVILLNDLEATAYGIAVLDPQKVVVLNEGGLPRPGNIALIAAGTGLGEAMLVGDGGKHRVSASEGGHADFAPRDAEQIELLRYLMAKFDHVSYERLVSGPGLLNIYNFLKESGFAKEPAWLFSRLSGSADASAVITETALSAQSELCTHALELFVSIYGAEAGNLALKALATAGVYVGGGIAPKILPKLKNGTFVRAFRDKGRFSKLLDTIPVRVILDPKTALRGAAYYLASQTN